MREVLMTPRRPRAARISLRPGMELVDNHHRTQYGTPNWVTRLIVLERMTWRIERVFLPSGTAYPQRMADRHIKAQLREGRLMFGQLRMGEGL